MILKSIRLHPFGKFSDHTHTFNSGLDIIEGPNEHGKSTISNAVKHALYTSTFPIKGRKPIDGIERWFPHSKGSGAEVTLTVEHDGVTWTINKRWPGKGSTVLTSNVDDRLTGEDAERKIQEIMGFNEATWKHVFHTTQAELANTVSELSEKGTDLDDLVSSASASATQDVSAERFLQLINDRIDVQFSRWDDVYDGPEGGRGIENPWKTKVGVIYSAFIEWKLKVDEKNKLDRYNEERDRLESERAEHEAFIAKHSEAVRSGAALRKQLETRSATELDIAHLESDVADLKKNNDIWPKAEANLENSTKELQKLKASLETLKKEYSDAERQNTAEATRKTYQKITDARDTLAAETAKLDSCRSVDEQTIEKAVALEQRKGKLETQIAAHKLTASITTERSISISYASGRSEPQQIALHQGASWNLEDIPGEVRFQLDGVTISVASSTADIQTLGQELQQTEHALRDLLHSNGVDSLESLKRMRDEFQKQLQSRARAESSYQQFLDGMSFEQWQARFDALKDLPQTRSMSDINTQMVSTQSDIRHHEQIIQDAERDIQSLTALYTDKGSLIAMMGKAAVKLDEKRTELASLPEVPQGYQSADEFIRYLEVLSDQLKLAESRREGVAGELRRMPAPPTEMSTSELADLVELTHDAYQRALHEGAALKRIRDVVARKAAEMAELSPLQKLPQLVSKHFAKLTNGAYSNVEMDDNVPLTTSGKALANFDVSKLSQGTKTSLALATRLALAESYLENRQGVIMLDDPFVDMDTERRNAAMALIEDVSKAHQIVMFTCHSYTNRKHPRVPKAETVG